LPRHRRQRPSLPPAVWRCGSPYVLGKRLHVHQAREEGIAEYEHALALDRNLVTAHASIGQGKIYIGRAEETEAYIAEALRLSPRDKLAYIWMSMVALAKLHLGSYEQAVTWFRRSKEVNRNYSSAYFNMAAALAHLGRLDEGHSVSRSTQPIPSPASAPPGRRGARIRHSWPNGAHSRRHAQGRAARVMTAVRRGTKGGFPPNCDVHRREIPSVGPSG
jgi:tetratricopeptide (TPR) repeat protein